MTRVAIIGDVHGHADELKQMCSLLEAHGVDEIVMLGDLVDRGPASLGCWRLASRTEFWSRQKTLKPFLIVRGNHEDAYDRVFRNVPKPGSKVVHGPEERATYMRFTDTDLTEMASLPVTIKLEALGIVCIHGGFEPSCADPDDPWNCRVRYLSREGRSLPATSTSDTFWAKVYDGRFGFAAFGHESHRWPTLYKNAIALDGEGYRRLHAVVVSDEEGDERFTPFTIEYGKGRIKSKLSDKPERIHDWRAKSWGDSDRWSSSSLVSSRSYSNDYTVLGGSSRPLPSSRTRAAKTPEQREMFRSKPRFESRCDFVYVDYDGVCHELDEIECNYSEGEIGRLFIRMKRDDVTW